MSSAPASTTKKRKAATASLLTDANLRHRLALGATSAGGSRGSLTRCAVRLGQLIQQAKNGDDEEQEENQQQQQQRQQATISSLLCELQLAQIDLTKLYHEVQAYETDCQDLDDSYNKTQGDIELEQALVQKLRKDLQQASSTQSCQQEYEALAKMCRSRHATPRRVLQKQLHQIQQEHGKLKAELKTTTKHVKIRQCQFQLLVQSMLDLKQSLKEPLEVGDANKDDAEVENDAADDNDKMQVDEDDKKKPAKDNDDDLYDDL